MREEPEALAKVVEVGLRAMSQELAASSRFLSRHPPREQRAKLQDPKSLGGKGGTSKLTLQSAKDKILTRQSQHTSKSVLICSRNVPKAFPEGSKI